jgi:hypothetical protein
MYQAMQQAKAQAADSTAGKWWTEKSNEVLWALQQGKFVDYPEGAFWLLNPHTPEARAKIIGTFLDAYSLDALLDNEEQAIAKGVPNAKSICGEARKARAQRKAPRRDAGIDPGVALAEDPEHPFRNDPQYVDKITSGHYDTIGREFWVDHEDGSHITLNLTKVLNDAAPRQGPPVSGETKFADGSSARLIKNIDFIYYYRAQSGKIWPNKLTAATAPNIVAAAREVEEALPQAAAGHARLRPDRKPSAFR